MSIDQLLNEISDKTMAKDFWILYDDTRRAYKLKKFQVSRIHEFVDVITDFIKWFNSQQHLVLNRFPPTIPPLFHNTRIGFYFYDSLSLSQEKRAAVYFLERIFGTVAQGFICVTSGETSITEILDQITEIAKQSITSRLRNRAIEYFELDAQIRLLKEYKVKFRRFLPKEYQTGSVEIFYYKFKEIILRHVTQIAPAISEISEKG